MGGESISRRSKPIEGPRERLERGGLSALSDTELLSVVLGHGTTRAPAAALAAALLTRSCGVHGLIRLTADEIRQTRGIGAAQAARVMAALELGRRTLTAPLPERPTLASAEDVAEYLLPRFGAWAVERFGLMLLDGRHRLLRTQLLSIGTRDASFAHPRDVFRVAVGAAAAGVIVFHNHPSGDPSPSPEDLRLTARLVSAGRVIGIPVLDHLILADSQFYSFRRSGTLHTAPAR